jgi:site-specific DNA recombinase
MINHEEYQDSIEANNKELTDLMKQKNEFLTFLESEDVTKTMDKLKQELLHFLNFDELTPEILHRFINRIDVKEDGTTIIHYRFAAPKIE